MERGHLLKRLQSLKDKGLEVIFTTDSEYLNISSDKLLSSDNVLIKTSNTFDEVEKMIEKIEVDFEKNDKTSLFDYLSKNLK
jgi:hypothetical protein